jgi:hypothetical protein
MLMKAGRPMRATVPALTFGLVLAIGVLFGWRMSR